MIRERRTDKHGPESRDERGETTGEEERGRRVTGGLKRKKICMKVREVEERTKGKMQIDKLRESDIE